MYLAEVDIEGWKGIEEAQGGFIGGF